MICCFYNYYGSTYLSYCYYWFLLPLLWLLGGIGLTFLGMSGFELSYFAGKSCFWTFWFESNFWFESWYWILAWWFLGEGVTWKVLSFELCFCSSSFWLEPKKLFCFTGGGTLTYPAVLASDPCTPTFGLVDLLLLPPDGGLFTSSVGMISLFS